MISAFDMSSDAQLIRTYLKTGCPQAARKLCVRYEQPVYHFLRSMLGQKEDAEDLTQQTFIKAIRGLVDYRERGQFKSWLYQIARTEVLMHVRKGASRPETSAERLDDIPVAAGPSAYDDLAQAERIQALQLAIEQLPDLEKEVVVLRLKAELPFREIAEVTGSPLNTVLGRMHNATHRLRDIMKEVEP